MKGLICVITCSLFWFASSYAESKSSPSAKATEDKIGDFFDGKKAKYNVEFKIFGLTYSVPASINFEKISDEVYKTELVVDTKSIKYHTRINGVIHNNTLYPIFIKEKTKIIALSYNTEYEYFYDENYNATKVHVVFDGNAKIKEEKNFTKLSKKHQTTDIVSGVLQIIYCDHSNQKLPILDVIKSKYIFRNAQLESYQKDGVRYAKLKDEKQEEDFDFKNLLVQLSDRGWPKVISLDQHWILKKIKITLTSLK